MHVMGTAAGSGDGPNSAKHSTSRSSVGWVWKGGGYVQDTSVRERRAPSVPGDRQARVVSTETTKAGRGALYYVVQRPTLTLPRLCMAPIRGVVFTKYVAGARRDTSNTVANLSFWRLRCSPRDSGRPG